MLGALYEDDVRAVTARRTLAGYEAVLRDRFFYVPHDAIVPGALAAGDLCDVAAALAPRPLRLEGLVDGRNREMRIEDVRQAFAPVFQAYRTTADRLFVTSAMQEGIADWLVKSLSDRSRERRVRAASGCDWNYPNTGAGFLGRIETQETRG